ncbi:hypothetical protein ZWY2020_003597 [Hordeum vulgare]|nr:hypothetical protein ZWY2020_003597 [Hordeum vulgare]
MDTDNAATSQQVGLPSEVIHLEDDDQRGSGPALAPVLEVVPSATAPTMVVPPIETMPSTETVPLAANRLKRNLGCPRSLLSCRKTCEMGSAYNALKAEKIQLAADLEAAVNDLTDFCLDAEAEAADIERSVVPNIPLGDEANRDLLRAHIRLGRVGPFIGRLREIIGRIDKELWPEDDSRREIEGLMTRLEDTPNKVQAWKKSAACCGADVVLSLVQVHCKEAREQKLKALQVANTKKLRLEDFMETFLETATRIADGIDLDTFVEPASPGASPGDA